MPNINTRKAIEKISNDLGRLVENVAQYSGIAAKDAQFVDNVATQVCESAAMLAAVARETQGNHSAERLVKDVRRALGFSQP